MVPTQDSGLNTGAAAVLVARLTADLYEYTPDFDVIMEHSVFLAICTLMQYDKNRRGHFAKCLAKRILIAKQNEDARVLENDILRYLRMYPRKLK